jgi:hypothetical protein
MLGTLINILYSRNQRKESVPVNRHPLARSQQSAKLQSHSPRIKQRIRIRRSLRQQVLPNSALQVTAPQYSVYSLSTPPSIHYSLSVMHKVELRMRYVPKLSRSSICTANGIIYGMSGHMRGLIGIHRSFGHCGLVRHTDQLSLENAPP